MGLTTGQVKRGIEKLQSLGGRFHMIEKGDMLIIDDCYNANPVSMKASLDVLKDADRRTVAVLGDMFELGENEALLHGEVGAYAGEKEINLLICTGELSRYMAEEAIHTGGCETVVHVPNLERLMEVLPRLVQGDDTILVKASHGMHFEKVVELLSEL